MQGKPTPPETIERIRAWAANGLTQPEIAGRAKLTQSTIGRLARKHGIAITPAPKGTSKYTDGEWRQLRRSRQGASIDLAALRRHASNGLTLPAACRIMGAQYGPAYTAANRHGIVFLRTSKAGRKRVSNPKIAKVSQSYQRGATVAALADRHGVSTMTIRHWLDLGNTPRKQSPRYTADDDIAIVDAVRECAQRLRRSSLAVATRIRSLLSCGEFSRRKTTDD